MSDSFLTMTDKVRLAVKAYEFSMSPSVHRLACKAGIIGSPFVQQDHDFGAIFIHVPKSAGTSIRRSLYGSKSYHIPAIRYRAGDPEKFESYFKFTFVRNPWDRMDSAFHYLWDRRDAGNAFRDHRWAHDYFSACAGFQDFILQLDADETFRAQIRAYLHFRDQMDWIGDCQQSSNPLIVDFVGRYETLARDYKTVQSRLGVSSPLAKERIRSDKADYRHHYDSPMVDIVARFYEKDINALSYTFE